MQLTDIEIEDSLDNGTTIMEPRPAPEAISGVSVDVKLGNQFRVFKDHTAPYIDLIGISTAGLETVVSRISQDS
ncbi:deoxycytidine triphosphate deaminase [Shewanella pealeana ATCC 700345]|uniref:Deoxycytidine triphosphate deaminase n=1 Tax=Shewanella pealeana (strain ATCC 700345 / ANG-SQ1) TaxID=398579 RepID=A8H3V5_SHEPA|nr:deoxycytidine triphosphate deaminase [Shewanella pealeana ATCC 700345]